jgi:hypothetical protein
MKELKENNAQATQQVTVSDRRDEREAAAKQRVNKT